MLPSRIDDGIVIDTDNYEYKYLCAELTNKRMVPILARIKSSTLHDFGKLEQHEGEEFLIVLKGTVEVRSEFYAPVTLQQGKAFTSTAPWDMPISAPVRRRPKSCASAPTPNASGPARPISPVESRSGPVSHRMWVRL
ncbi:cupin domain-containing protein [Sulfitobacter porphyrae]|uniref:Cupin domain-containing protein n=1 Tax=Sulfitobacter porphyrae TaxID=1246864 RepID=A0ABW2B810_9RHOB